MDGLGEKSTGKTVAIVVLAFVCLVLIGLQFLQKGALNKAPSYDKFAGVTNDSFEYQNYKMCVNTCGKCEVNCKDSLLRDSAMNKRDESFCSQMSEEWARTSCANSIYSAKALAEKDKSYCEKITEELMKTDCTASVVTELAVAQENIELCNQAPEGRADSCKESWHYRMAIKNGDESQCSQLANTMSQDMCRNEVKMAKQMFKDRSMSIADICSTLRISRATLYRYTSLPDI